MSILLKLFGKKNESAVTLELEEKKAHKNPTILYDGEEIELDDDAKEKLKIYNENIEMARNGDCNAQFLAGKALFDYSERYYFAINRGSEAMELLKMAAEKGNIGAAYKMIGDYYSSDRYGEEDLILALEWYKKGAETGDPNAYWSIGNAYDNGKGVDKDPYTAFEYYLKAADLGEPYSMREVGVALCEGNIVEQDKEKAFPYLKGAYEQGEKTLNCGFYLAQYYMNGEYTEQDPEKCVEILEDLCFDNGLFSEEECNLLLYCYENGVGTSVDFEAANRLREKKKEQDDLFSILVDNIT